MISPSQIREKAVRLYPQAIESWLMLGTTANYPRRIPANIQLSDTHSDNIREVEQLRIGSKEFVGFGYTVAWESRKSRRFGANDYFPAAIQIDSLADLVKLIGKTSKFQSLESNVTKIRSQLPELEPWIRRSWKQLLHLDDATVDELIQVAIYLKKYPRPGCFARELPLPVPTKLIQNHQYLLRGWLDILLPPESIDCSCDASLFEQRYGFRYPQCHILTRILDEQVGNELNVFTSELSLPVNAIATMGREGLRVIIVENQVTLLTLPTVHQGIAFFGMGKGVTQLFGIDWIAKSSLTYWGDLDVDGFQILSLLRRHYPNTVSVLMDMQTICEFQHLGTRGTGQSPNEPTDLTASELEAFRYLRLHNLRIEQEHILQTRVNASFSSMHAS